MKSFLSVCISTLLIALAGPVIADSNQACSPSAEPLLMVHVI